jgi:Protein of unknown function (DUF2911)
MLMEATSMRKNIFAICAVAAMGLAVLTIPAKSQQDKSKRPSPPAHAEYKFADGGMISIDYSSPRLKGRKIVGEQDPYGKPWRAGANEATTFVTDKNVHIGGAAGGLDVPAGSYTLFAIPYADKPWTLIISKKTGEWGIPYPGEQFELGRTEMKTSALSSPLENFTIGLTAAGGDASVLHMDWDTWSVSVKITEKK